ncbi:MAG: CAP domain-containing protein, partial [Actinomycetales bacterium]|nr:CAP domain-containing protein [Actinomycetales bacterium]
TTSTVVEAWRISPGHYANMIGDYTHVGIGVYEGPYGYKRYFTTVFAKY